MRASEEVGVRYMQAWEEKYYEREEGREEGREELLKEQIAKKLEKGKTLEAIADEVEKDVEEIRGLVEELKNQRNAI